MSTSPFRVGDKVTPARAAGVPASTLGRIFTVDRVNPKNIRCTADDGGRGINYPADILLPATPENLLAARGEVSRPFVPMTFFEEGQVVTIDKAYKEFTAAEPFIVTKDGGRDTVNIVRLGGDGGRYLRWPRTRLTARDRAWLANYLMEEQSR